MSCSQRLSGGNRPARECTPLNAHAQRPVRRQGRGASRPPRSLAAGWTSVSRLGAGLVLAGALGVSGCGGASPTAPTGPAGPKPGGSITGRYLLELQPAPTCTPSMPAVSFQCGPLRPARRPTPAYRFCSTASNLPPSRSSSSTPRPLSKVGSAPPPRVSRRTRGQGLGERNRDGPGDPGQRWPGRSRLGQPAGLPGDRRNGRLHGHEPQFQAAPPVTPTTGTMHRGFLAVPCLWPSSPPVQPASRETASPR